MTEVNIAELTSVYFMEELTTRTDIEVTQMVRRLRTRRQEALDASAAKARKKIEAAKRGRGRKKAPAHVDHFPDLVIPIHEEPLRGEKESTDANHTAHVIEQGHSLGPADPDDGGDPEDSEAD